MNASKKMRVSLAKRASSLVPCGHQSSFVGRSFTAKCKHAFLDLLHLSYLSYRSGSINLYDWNAVMFAALNIPPFLFFFFGCTPSSPSLAPLLRCEGDLLTRPLDIAQGSIGWLMTAGPINSGYARECGHWLESVLMETPLQCVCAYSCTRACIYACRCIPTLQGWPPHHCHFINNTSHT